MTTSSTAEAAVEISMVREQQCFLARNPQSVALAERAQRALFDGVSMHWMSDWSTPCPLFVEYAHDARFHDVNGHAYVDFCLGDTGSVFDHSPASIARVLAEQGANDLTTMLPGEDATIVGELLAQRLGLPFWQVATTATDANRFVLCWTRAITGRKVVLVFDGCYHGTVDDTLVRRRDGRTVHRSGLLGQAHDLTQFGHAAPFNDLQALEQALVSEDVAAVLCEPAITNIGTVLPQPGFHQKLRELIRRHGTLLIINEIHTISTGSGGCTRAWKLEPDFITLGKPIVGGVPCPVCGCNAAMANVMQLIRTYTSKQSEGHSHSGTGTMLSANALAMRCMRANLEEVMTGAAYARMLPSAARLAGGFRRIIHKRGLAWPVTELGARSEFQFCPQSPRDGAAAEAAFHDSLQMALRLYLINRGILITPFHNITPCRPDTREEDVDRLLSSLDEALGELLAVPGAREA